jgi:hypothetical protein
LQRLGDRPRSTGEDSWKEDAESVAAQPGRDGTALCGSSLSDRLRDRHEQPVAGVVAQGIVGRLQTVYVGQDHADGLELLGVAGYRLLPGEPLRRPVRTSRLALSAL